MERECTLTRYFNGKGLAARVVAYIAEGAHGWLLTEKVAGNDCAAARYLAEPERLCDTLAERLSLLHALDHERCPVADHTEQYLDNVEENHRQQRFDMSIFPTQDWGFATPEEAYAIVREKGHLLETNTLLHGDYCLPNVVLDDWRFSGFVDLGSGGVGDRHVDLFWGAWTLAFNLKTDRLRARFLDAYGRDRVDDERLQLVAACEVFQ